MSAERPSLRAQQLHHSLLDSSCSQHQFLSCRSGIFDAGGRALHLNLRYSSTFFSFPWGGTSPSPPPTCVILRRAASQVQLFKTSAATARPFSKTRAGHGHSQLACHEFNLQISAALRCGFQVSQPRTASSDCHECSITRPYKDAQNRLLWRDKTCPART